MIKKIPYGRQSIDEDEIAEVVKVLKSDFLTQGPKVSEFENNFAHAVGAKYAVAVSSGTAALHLSCLALELSAGSRVLTTPITFSASANCVQYCGGEVDFVDIDPSTYLMDLDLLEKKIKSKPSGYYTGIIIVDFTGLPVNTEKLNRIAAEHNIWIIEDACHAPGAGYRDSNDTEILCGSSTYSDLTCFSFHPVKHIACGEGGMITTNDENVYQKLKSLRTHGITKEDLSKSDGGWYYEMQDLGFNYRIPDINCALGISQLKKLKNNIEKRRQIANTYFNAFNDNDSIKLQTQPKDYQNAYHLFVIEVDNRKELYDFLLSKNILAQIHYIPVHLMPYYAKKGFKKGDFPLAENYYEKCISLPIFPTLSKAEQSYVIETISDFYQ